MESTDGTGDQQSIVNNAAPAGMGPTPVADVQPAEWQRTVHGIQDGVFQTVQAALSAMRADDWGRIVTISSDAAENGPENMAAYATAKAGLHGLTKVLAGELGEAEILSNAVLPGMVLTEKNAERVPETIRKEVAERTPTKRITTPEDVANLVVFLGSPVNGNINGELIEVSGGLSPVR
jgi:NAD(P)-dependent dehydrogenase (short-subunit alcohol dehydrogenase family)